MDFFCFFLHCPTQLFARGREIVCLYGCRLAYTINVVLEMSVFCRSALHWCYHDNWIHVNEHLRITVDFHFITDRYYAYFLLLSVRRHYKYIPDGIYTADMQIAVSLLTQMQNRQRTDRSSISKMQIHFMYWNCGKPVDAIVFNMSTSCMLVQTWRFIFVLYSITPCCVTCLFQIISVSESLNHFLRGNTVITLTWRCIGG